MKQLIKSKALAGFIALAMVTFVTPAQAAVIGSINLTGSPVAGGSTFAVTGSCPSGGSVSYSLLNSNGTTTSLGTSTTNGASGNFATNLSIPSTTATGNSTLIATCSNGDTVTLPINVLANGTTSPSINLTGSPVAGGSTFGTNGICPTAGTVTYSLVGNNGVVTNIGSSSTTLSGTNNTFSTNLSIPSTYSTGNTTLVATCPNGVTVTQPITVLANPTTVVNGINLTGTPVAGSGTFGLNGSCPTSGTVTYSLVNSNGTVTNLGTTSTTNGANNSFSTNLSIPSTYSTGNTTLVATCPNGTAFTQAINILAPSTDLITFNTPAPAISGTVNASGVCGASSNGSPVTFTLTQGGVTTNLSTTTTANGANGAFTANVVLPTNQPAGIGTLTAYCGNGQTVSTLAVIGDPNAINLSLFPVNPVLNSTFNVSGLCPTTSTGVTFSVQQNGVTTSIGGNANVGTNGAYTANITLPSILNAGAANIIATCNNNGGSVTTGAVLGVSTPTGSVLGANTGSKGTVAGVSTTPVGGVRAGNGGTADSGSMTLFFLLTGVVAMALVFAGKQMQNNA